MMCGGALIDAAKDFDLAVNVNASPSHITEKKSFWLRSQSKFDY
jgi:hypothetical protein